MSFKENIISAIKKFNMINSGDRIVVGLSGGADSCALAHILSTICIDMGFTIIAAHLNHGIRGEESLRDKEFSKKFASSLGMDIITEDANVPEYAKSHKLSEEMAARIVRYEFFDKVCAQYDCNKIAVAHNKNDNAETIILNMIRGSGAKGFEGIQPVNGRIIRPLIEVSRQEIEDYTELNNIHYVTDSTNLDDIYARNIVRSHVLPAMRRINSGVINNIIRCSEIISSESNYMEEELTRHNLFKICDNGVFIDRHKFTAVHPAIASRAVFRAISLLRGDTMNVSSKQVNLLIANVKTGNSFSFGSDICVNITPEEVVFTKYIHQVPPYEYEITVPGIANIPESGFSYRFEYVNEYENTPNSVCISADGIETFVLRTKKDGDTFKPYGMQGRKKVKNFYIDSKIPAFERNLYPLLVSGNTVLAVVPLRIDEDFKITEKTQKILRITRIGGTYDKL